MLLSKTWENIIFPGSKMDSLHILCISAFSISEDAFTLCIGFFNRFRKMLFEAETIDSIFYVSHHYHTYIYTYMYRYVHNYI